MDTIEQFIESIVTVLQKLDGAPAVALVLVSCIVLGYVLKRVPKFPNDGIPMAVILWGCIVNPLLADMNVEVPLRIWMVRGVVVGGVTGFVAWMVHNVVLSKIETRLGLFGKVNPEKKETPE